MDNKVRHVEGDREEHTAEMSSNIGECHRSDAVLILGETSVSGELYIRRGYSLS